MGLVLEIDGLLCFVIKIDTIPERAVRAIFCN